MSTARLEQIGEAMADLELVFADPDCFHSPGSRDPRPVQDYAVSLASEFVGAYRDDEITGRLAKLVDAEDAGQPKDARRHLTFVRRKVAARMREWEAEAADSSDATGQGPQKPRSPRAMIPQERPTPAPWSTVPDPPWQWARDYDGGHHERGAADRRSARVARRARLPGDAHSGGQDRPRLGHAGARPDSGRLAGHRGRQGHPHRLRRAQGPPWTALRRTTGVARRAVRRRRDLHLAS